MFYKYLCDFTIIQASKHCTYISNTKQIQIQVTKEKQQNLNEDIDWFYCWYKKLSEGKVLFDNLG